MYSLDLVNHTRHAQDATFMIGKLFFPYNWSLGIHLPEKWTKEEILMAEYYPKMVKKFIKTGVPDEGNIVKPQIK